ncbi:USP6 N-terminal-like protein isoform X1 [Enhydra lutris kenyoni]|uniref:USP6 N-terminal-like protein isoform X1 n=1 Tax=Enhydra lutris kenyoni TaxID=391180 RepID=A0A2Y9IQL9_ENHLU|nr:USP6 N-terminal-like protein isoform X1 [Enhydra lutris kenyoni]XP_022348311.1 USP6 N-terminal-like protein isoform X1 [Enhydra lutris kenyoni]
MLRNWDHCGPSEKMRWHFYKGVHPQVRGQVWALLLDIEKVKSTEQGLYKFCPQKMKERAQVFSKNIRQIDLDVNRTFRNHIMFRDCYGIRQRALFHVLRAYSVYDPEVGYCQGMSDIVAILVMFLGEEDAFWALAQLMTLETHAMHGFFAPGFPKLARFQRHHDDIVEKELKGLKKHLDERGMSAGLYTTRWFLQCFIGRTPFALTLKLWDAYMLDGERVLTAMAYTVLRLHRSKGPRGSPGVSDAGVGGRGDGPLLPGVRTQGGTQAGRWLGGPPAEEQRARGLSCAALPGVLLGTAGRPTAVPGQDPGTVGRRPSALTHTHCPERLLKLPLEGLQGFLQDTLAQPWALEDEAVLKHLRASMAHLRRRKCDLPPPAGPEEFPKMPLGQEQVSPAPTALLPSPTLETLSGADGLASPGPATHPEQPGPLPRQAVLKAEQPLQEGRSTQPLAAPLWPEAPGTLVLAQLPPAQDPSLARLPWQRCSSLPNLPGHQGDVCRGPVDMALRPQHWVPFPLTPAGATPMATPQTKPQNVPGSPGTGSLQPRREEAVGPRTPFLP